MITASARGLVVVVTLLGLLASTVLAGTLEDFEADATHNRSNDNPSRRRDNSSNDNDGLLSGLSFDDAFGLSMALIVAPGAVSWARASGDPGFLNDPNNDGIEPRKPGEPFIPILRADLATLDLESDVEAIDWRIQGGWGPFAVEFNPTFYEEQDPDDKLDLYRLWGLYRMSFGNHVEIDLGAGGIFLEGNESHAGSSFTTPILVQPRDWLLVEFRPIWSQINGSNLTEYEAGVLLNWKNVAVKAGYRWTHSPERSLDGHFLGLTARF